MEGSGALFGRGLGRVLGEVWRLWRPRGSFFGIVFSCLYLGWFWQVVLEASGLDFGSILGCFGRILGGFWEGLESVFGGELILNLNVELISNRSACESANVGELARVPVQNQFHV